MKSGPVTYPNMPFQITKTQVLGSEKIDFGGIYCFICKRMLIE